MRVIGRLLGQIGLVVGAVLTVVALAASPASAHYNYINRGGHFASISSDHERVSVCNRASGADPYVHMISFGGGFWFTDTTTNGRCSTYETPGGLEDWELCIGFSLSNCSGLRPV
jgi:hypothetical protein